MLVQHITLYTFCLVSYRYVRLLGAMYMRLTGTSVDCYKYLEPLYNDYRKVKMQNRNGGIHMCLTLFLHFLSLHQLYVEAI